MLLATALASYIEALIQVAWIPESWVPYIAMAVLLVGACIACWIVDIAAKKTLLELVSRIVRRTKTTWDDALLENKVFKNLAHLAPALAFEWMSPTIFYHTPDILPLVEKLVSGYMILVILIAVGAFINSLRSILSNAALFKDKPVDGYFQLAKIVIYIIGGVLITSNFLDKSPFYFFSAFGAMTAIVLLVFKDTILGFVASIQLGANDMIRVGDWVEMPKYGADGDVTEINLTTVKVSNWDKTITTIPTYAFISDSFRNWRGMSESGGRRIKRAVYINMSTIKFCDEAMLDRFRNVDLLADHVETKITDIAAHNAATGINPSIDINGRRLTNLGIFRAYVYQYLQEHSWINQEMTILVRQLQPTEFGIPLEIYCFSTDKVWANYENIQSDIFDHILAAVPQFDLAVFQSPSGKDFQQLK